MERRSIRSVAASCASWPSGFDAGGALLSDEPSSVEAEEAWALAAQSSSMSVVASESHTQGSLLRQVRVAVSGDEDAIPAPLRAVLSGRRLAAAGGVVALLSPVAEAVASSKLNVSVFAVEGGHVLAIAFGSDADLLTVQEIGRESCAMIADILAAPL